MGTFIRMVVHNLGSPCSWAATRPPYTTLLIVVLAAPTTVALVGFCDTLRWFKGRNILELMNSFVDSDPNAKGPRVLTEGIARRLLDDRVRLPQGDL